MEFLCLIYLVHCYKWTKSWPSCLEVRSFLRSRKNRIFFQFHFELSIWTIYHSFDNRIWFRIIFRILKVSPALSSRYSFFYYIFTYFVAIGVIKDRITKINSSILTSCILKLFFISPKQSNCLWSWGYCFRDSNKFFIFSLLFLLLEGFWGLLLWSSIEWKWHKSVIPFI